jgi:hypothetical protein
MMQIEKWAYLTMKIGATSDGAAGVVGQDCQARNDWLSLERTYQEVHGAIA